ncbi:hypothetical protein AHAS_Ahas03G0225900 [Arachis hypogaea]
MACHAFDLMWPAQLFLPFSSTGVPRLDAQVAHPRDGWELVCHTFDIKWHAQLYLAFSSTGVPRLGLQVACPRVWAFVFLFSFLES